MFPRLPYFLRENLCSRCSSSSSQLRTWLVGTFLFRFPVFGFFPPPPPHSQQLGENKVRVSVWWDFDKCPVPSGYSVWKIVPSIIGTLRANGINGPVDLRAYGDVYRFSMFERIALTLTGVRLRHITDEMRKHKKRKNACDYLFYDLNWWTYKNPPPVHLFIICGDVRVSALLVLYWRRMKNNYNILVACPGRTYDVLRGATTIMWHWSSILKGEGLTGKLYNYPPDGPFDSWYGDSKVTLEPPFPIAEELTSSQNAKIAEYLRSEEASKVTLENPFSAVEEPTSSKKQGFQL